MPLKRVPISVPLTAGLNQKADLRSLAVNGAASMTNCVMQKTGAVRKRYGHTALSKAIASGGAIAAAVAGGSYKAAPWLTDGESFYSWSDIEATWSKQDSISDCVALDRIGVGSFTQAIADMDHAYGNGLLVVAYTCDANGLGYAVPYFTVIDPAQKAIVVPTSLVDFTITSQINAPKLVVCGTTAVLTYVVQSSTSIVARTLDLTNVAAGWSAAITLATDGEGNCSFGVYDVAAVAGDPTRFAIAYEVSSGGNHVAIKTASVSPLIVLATALNETTHTALISIAVVATSGEYLWAVYAAPDSIPVNAIRTWAVLDGTISTFVAPFTLGSFAGGDTPGRVAAARVDATHITGYWSPFLSVSATNGLNLSTAYVKSRMGSTAGATVGQTQITGGCVLSSKVAVTNAAAYVGVQTPSTFQGTAFLCRDDGWGIGGSLARPPLRAVATLDPRLAKYTTALFPTGNLAQVAPNLVNLATVGPSVWGLLVFESTSPTHTAIYEHCLDLTANRRYSAAEMYELEAIAAGVPSVYDGQTISELEYLAYPEIASTAYATTGGSMQTSGTYLYSAVYEWYDARGQRHQSATAPTVAVTASGSGNTGSCVVTLPGLALTQRHPLPSGPTGKTSAYVVLYRSLVNGTTLYRVSTDPPPAVQQVSAGLAIPITDMAADLDISGNELLYTTGGDLDVYCPPSARICVQHRNRWWLAGCPDPTALWPSKELTTGEAPGFNEAFNFTCTGAIRALASMDDKLVVFVQRGATYGIECITGEGPTDAGTQSDWTPPQAVPSDCGATDQRSVCVGPFGTLFRSPVGGPTGAGGIFLLSRDLQVSYLSGPVEDLLAANPVVTSAVMHPNAGRVYFTCVPSDVGFTSGVRLVWDYLQGGVWSVDTIGDPDTSEASAGARCSFVATAGAVGMAYHWVTSTGRVYRETHGGAAAGAFLDAGVWISMTYATAWLKPEEGGFSRFWRVLFEADCLETASPPNFTVTLTFDGAPASYYSEPSTWAGNTLAAFDRFPQVDLEITPGNQKSKSIQVTYQDTSGGPNGAGLSLGGLVLEIGLKDGTYRNIPSGQRA